MGELTIMVAVREYRKIVRSKGLKVCEFLRSELGRAEGVSL